MHISERIKMEAQRLFAIHGLEAVTVRDIVAAADLKNPGSLNYHFRSKEELISQVIREVMGEANALWGQRLAAVRDAGGPRELRDVVAALVVWPLSQNPDERNPYTARFLSNVVNSRAKMLSTFIRELKYQEYDRALQYMKGFLKHLPEPIVNQRLIFFYWSLTSFLAVYETVAEGGIKPDSVWSRADPFANFINSMVALLSAPVDDISQGAKELA
ncbi:MAG: TetR/AcrR family transcriptional regulator [Janthinobacterium lividum]